MIIKMSDYKVRNSDEYIRDKFMQAYYKGYIGECRKLGAIMGLPHNKIEYYITETIISNKIKLRISQRQDAQACDAIDNIEYYDSDEAINNNEDSGIMSLYLPHDKWITVTDRLYEIYSLLIIITPKINFAFGHRSYLAMLHNKLGGDIKVKYGLHFWAGKASKEEIEKLVLR